MNPLTAGTLAPPDDACQGHIASAVRVCVNSTRRRRDGEPALQSTHGKGSARTRRKASEYRDGLD